MLVCARVTRKGTVVPTAPSDDPGRLVAVYWPPGSQDGVLREKRCCTSAPCPMLALDAGDWRGFCSPHTPGGQWSWDGSCLYCSSSDAQGRPQIINTESSSTAPSCPSPDSSEQNSAVTAKGEEKTLVFSLALSLLPFLFNYPLLSHCSAGSQWDSMPWPTAGSRACSGPESSFGRGGCAHALWDGRRTQAHLPK